MIRAYDTEREAPAHVVVHPVSRCPEQELPSTMPIKSPSDASLEMRNSRKPRGLSTTIPFTKSKRRTHKHTTPTISTPTYLHQTPIPPPPSIPSPLKTPKDVPQRTPHLPLPPPRNHHRPLCEQLPRPRRIPRRISPILHQRTARLQWVLAPAVGVGAR